jgi:hypothetical protein
MAQPNSVILGSGVVRHGLYHGPVAGVLAGLSGADAGTLSSNGIGLDKFQAFLKKLYVRADCDRGVVADHAPVLAGLGATDHGVQAISVVVHDHGCRCCILISALAMGYGVVMLEATLVNRAFKTPSEVSVVREAVARRRRLVGGLPRCNHH